MNNFKLLTETKTIITKWAVPCDARLEDLDTRVIFDMVLEQVCDNFQPIEAPKAQVEYRKTLAFEELTPEEQEETSQSFYETSPPDMDYLMDAVETLLVQKPLEDEQLSTAEALLKSIENLEMLQRNIEAKLEELKRI